MQDAVRPDDETYKRVYEAGYRIWLELYERAITTPLKFSWYNMQAAFPRHPYLVSQIQLDGSSTSVLQATGQSTWETTEGRCDLSPLTIKTVLKVTTSYPTTISMQDTNPASLWDLKWGDGSHIPVLTLAWAYVLSARWAEIIPGASMGYTSNRAAIVRRDEKPDTSNTTVDVGVATDIAAQWWSAVLASGEGWNAYIHHNGRILKSPWAVKLQSPDITILRDGPSSQRTYSTPPTYSSAVSYILEYVAYHDIHDQSYAAFAAALLLPTRQRISKCVYWRLPRFRSKLSSPHIANHGNPPWGRNKQQLDMLLTMSCNAIGVQSLLSSSFVEPDLPCNICGAWLQGAFAVIDSPSAQELPILAEMLMRRSPSLDFLWLGAILVDIHQYVMKWARPAAYLVDLHSASWTDTYVSFIQKPVSIYPLNGEISRSDEARLMFLAQSEHHKAPPLVPFTPFGFIALKDCVLDVQLHGSCSGHHGLKYAGWSWDCRNNTSISQNGDASFWGQCTKARTGVGERLAVHYGKLDRDNDCSESMTRNVFKWLREADGYPMRERAIRKHPWIADATSSDEESDTPEGDGRSTSGRNVGKWLSKHMTTRCYTI